MNRRRKRKWREKKHTHEHTGVIWNMKMKWGKIPTDCHNVIMHICGACEWTVECCWTDKILWYVVTCYLMLNVLRVSLRSFFFLPLNECTCVCVWKCSARLPASQPWRKEMWCKNTQPVAAAATVATVMMMSFISRHRIKGTEKRQYALFFWRK